MTDQNDNEKRQQVIEKLTKLMAFQGEDAHAFQGEIANASTLIQTLMDKYSISEAELQTASSEKDTREAEEQFDNRTSEFALHGVKKWHWDLAKLIAHITHTKHYISQGRGESFISFYGSSGNREAAAMLFTQWVTAIDHMAKQATNARTRELINEYGYQPKFRQHLRAEDSLTFYRASWIEGCIVGMNEAVRKQEAERSREMSTALMVIDEKLVKAYRQFASVGFHNIRVKGSRAVSAAGYESGKQAGQGINLTAKPLHD